MQQSANKLWEGIGWGAVASVALHLSVAVLLLVHLRFEPSPPPKEQDVKVELVSPPSPKPEEKPQIEPAKNHAKPLRPLAFESAAAQTEQKTTEPTLPAAGQSETQGDLPASENASSAESKTEITTREVLPKTKPAPAEVNAATEPREAKEPPTQQTSDDIRSVPAPKQKNDETSQTSKPSETKPKQRSNQQVDARDIFSPKGLFDPRIMQTIGKLPRKGRIRQLCYTEALDQIRRQALGSYADILVPYGPAGGVITNDVLIAKGGAFRSRTNWYNVEFKCQVDADTTKVISFSFAIGGAVPRSQWNARQLPMN